MNFILTKCYNVSIEVKQYEFYEAFDVKKATKCYVYNLGGIATSIFSLYAGLCQCGHEVKVLSLSNTNKSFKEGNNYYIKSFPVFYYPDNRMSFAVNDPLLRELEEWNPDIIHVQTEWSARIFSNFFRLRSIVALCCGILTLMIDFYGVILGVIIMMENTDEGGYDALYFSYFYCNSNGVCFMFNELGKSSRSFWWEWCGFTYILTNFNIDFFFPNRESTHLFRKREINWVHSVLHLYNNLLH